MLRKTCKEACILGKSILITIDLPEKVKLIIERLESHGFEAYAVGGCVRDKILKRVPDDWDITTSAKPEEVKALFCVTIGVYPSFSVSQETLPLSPFTCSASSPSKIVFQPVL